MSQRKEKYARSLGRRMDKLEESRDRTGKKLEEYDRRLKGLEIITSKRAAYNWNFFEVTKERLREIERGVVVALLLDVLLAAALLIVAVNVG